MPGKACAGAVQTERPARRGSPRRLRRTQRIPAAGGRPGSGCVIAVWWAAQVISGLPVRFLAGFQDSPSLSMSHWMVPSADQS